MALPRLTGALRSFSNVTKQDNYNEEVADLKIKRSKLHEQKSKMQSINEDLKDILHAAKQIEMNCSFQKRKLDGKEEDEKMSRASDRFRGLR
uniref:Uncharacterized protein n=1 Tax=Rhinopithecus bieti TaxID=61621 RepID=A0A2K6LZU8_RHIBE